MFDYIFIGCMVLALFGAVAQLCVHFYDKGYASGQKSVKTTKNKRKRSYK